MGRSTVPRLWKIRNTDKIVFMLVYSALMQDRMKNVESVVPHYTDNTERIQVLLRVGLKICIIAECTLDLCHFHLRISILQEECNC